MAKEDFVVADRDGVMTAGEKTKADAASTALHEENVAFAETEGVRSAEFADYADALNSYGSRDDIEALADRRARDNASDPADQDFMREEPSTTPPTPGHPDGFAPASA